MARKQKGNKKKGNDKVFNKDPDIKIWEERLHQEYGVRKKFRATCNKIEKVYTGTVSPYSNNTDESATFNYNILWVNCQILIAALYSQNPNPDVRRRYKDSVDTLKIKKIRDPQEQQAALQEERDRVELYNDVGKKISILMERALTYVQDTQDYFGSAEDAVMSFIKFSAGQMRVRYKPYISGGETKRFIVAKDDNGKMSREDGEEIDLMSVLGNDEEGFYIEGEEVEEKLEHEELINEWVPINNFRWEPNAAWEDVNWCVIEHYLNEDELIAEFGEKVASEIPLTFTNDGDYVDQSKRKRQENKATKALVYECFDKRKKKVQTFPKDYHKILRDEKDPYELENFYPFPKPMFGTMGDDNISPIADYLYYQDQHTELNTITFRINRLLETIKYRGFVDGALGKLIDVENQGDGEFKPLDNFAQLAAMGGGTFDISKFLATVPIGEAVALLDKMYIYRQQTVGVIHEITGISDIVRGTSKASETLGAQQLKAQYNNLRLQPKTKEVERFFRDVKRIEAEFLAEQFENETLEAMTGMDVTEEMDEVLTSDLLRSYIVDVETDSTVVMDAAQDQRERSEALQAMTGILAQVMPLVQAGALDKELAGQFVLFGLKGFKGANELEDKIQEMLDASDEPPQQPPGQPGQPGAPGGQSPMVEKAQQIAIAKETGEARKVNAEAAILEGEASGGASIQ